MNCVEWIMDHPPNTINSSLALLYILLLINVDRKNKKQHHDPSQHGNMQTCNSQQKWKALNTRTMYRNESTSGEQLNPSKYYNNINCTSTTRPQPQQSSQPHGQHYVARTDTSKCGCDSVCECSCGCQVWINCIQSDRNASMTHTPIEICNC
eukprot:331013_1